MVKWVKNWFWVRQYNSELSELVGKLTDTIEDLKEKLGKIEVESSTPNYYIRQMMKRDILWYDYGKLDKTSQMLYYADCQNIVKGETFNNELNHLIADFIKFNANESKDFGQVMNIRAGIVALETLKERFEKIENPNKAKEEIDPFSVL